MYAVFAHVAPEITFGGTSQDEATAPKPPVLTSPAAFVLPEAHAVTVPALLASAPSAEA
jgi:hypothetical protein